MELNKRIDELKEDLVSSVQKLTQIKSVQDEEKPGMPYGEGVSKALNCALNICENLGFKTTNLDGYVGYAEYGTGEDYVAVLGHLDVVPEGEGWKYPPYAAEIHDGKIYARGTLDDKGPTVAALYGLKAIADLKLPLSKRVRIIFGTNEETGSAEIPYYLKREKAPASGFTPDAEYPIIYAEKGITIFDIEKDLHGSVVKYIKGGLRANMVPDFAEASIETSSSKEIAEKVKVYAEKTGFDYKCEPKEDEIVIKAYGLCAHGSLPQDGKNAIMQLFALLEELKLENSDLMDFIHFMNENVGFDVYGDKFGVGLSDEPSGKLSFNVGTVRMDKDKISMALNLRYPVTCKMDDLMNPFNMRIKGTGIKVTNFENQDPLYFPEDHPIITALQEVYKKETGLEPKLLAIGGGTYAKEMPNIVAFGPLFPGDVDLDHQVNECIEIDKLIVNAKIYAHAIYELAK